MEPEAIPLIAQQHADDESRDDLDTFLLKPERTSHDDHSVHGHRRSPSIQTIFVTSALVVSLLSLLWNAFAFSSALHAPAAVPNRIAVDALRKPSIYLGLERVPGYKARQGHGLPSTGTDGTPVGAAGPGVPTALARVSSRYPDISFEQDGWVLLTEDDRTIMSFPVPPGAGGQCALAGRFPHRAELGLEAPVQLLTIERDNGPSSDPSPSAPEIHFVVLSPLPLANLTWNTRPPARAALGSLVAGFGTNATSAPFDCPGEGFVVEAACRGGVSCRVEYAYPDLSTPVGTPGHQHPPVPLGVTLVRV